jgi:hypothetical protein
MHRLILFRFRKFCPEIYGDIPGCIRIGAANQQYLLVLPVGFSFPDNGSGHASGKDKRHDKDGTNVHRLGLE